MIGEKQLLVIAGIFVIFLFLVVAPVVELKVYDAQGMIILESSRRVVFGAQSFIPLVPLDADKAEVSVITRNYREFYECEDSVPTNLKEVREKCIYIGRDEARR